MILRLGEDESSTIPSYVSTTNIPYIGISIIWVDSGTLSFPVIKALKVRTLVYCIRSYYFGSIIRTNI